MIDLLTTKCKGVKKFIEESPTIGPLEPYEELAEKRALWTGGAGWTVPLVIIKTDEGVEGYGFCCGGTAWAGKTFIDRHFKNLLIGEDPFDTERIWDKLFRASIVFGRKGGAIEALSGVDVALWDIKGKALNVPVYKLLGGCTKRKIPTYASNLHPSDLYNPDYELLAKEAKEYVAQGYTRLKQRVCAGPREGRKGMGRNEMLVKTVREAVGNDVELMVETYMGWADLEYAVQMIRRLEKYDLTWVEEPLLPDDYEGYKRLKSRVGIPIAAGEHEFTKFGARDLIMNEMVDVIQFDVRRAGGLTECKKIAALAETFNIKYVPHIAYAEALHLIASCPQIPLAEVTPTPSWWENSEGGFSDSYIKGVPKPANGFIEVSEQPGIGVELDWDVIERIRIEE